MQPNLLNGDPQVFLNVRQVLGLVVPHAAALPVPSAMDYYQKYKKTDKKNRKTVSFCRSLVQVGSKQYSQAHINFLSR
jgi:hypothetical protein